MLNFTTEALSTQRDCIFFSFPVTPVNWPCIEQGRGAGKEKPAKFSVSFASRVSEYEWVVIEAGDERGGLPPHATDPDIAGSPCPWHSLPRHILGRFSRVF